MQHHSRRQKNGTVQHHDVAEQGNSQTVQVQSSLRANFAKRKASCYHRNDAVTNGGGAKEKKKKRSLPSPVNIHQL